MDRMERGQDNNGFLRRLDMVNYDQLNLQGTDASNTPPSAPDRSPDEDEHAAQIGEYGGRIEVIVLRCYQSNSSGSPSSTRPSSIISSGSSKRSSYMDDQEVPLMTGALFDGAGDSPPARHRSRSCQFPSKAQGLSSTLLQLRGGGASPPHTVHERSRQPRPGDKQDLPKFRFGGGLFYSGHDGGLLGRGREKTEQQSVAALRLRGGAGSDGTQAKKGSPSPAFSSRSYRLGRGDLPTDIKASKGSSSSYEPEATFESHRATKPKPGSTGSYTPDNTWGSGNIARGDNWGPVDGTWTWAEGNVVGHNPPATFPNSGLKQNKQRSISNTPSQKRDTKPTDAWDRTGGAKDGEFQREHEWDSGADRNDNDWNNTSNEDNQMGNNWDTSGDNGNSRQDGGWGVGNHDSDNSENGDQNETWNVTGDDGHRRQAANRDNAANQTGQWEDFNASIHQGTQENQWSAWADDANAAPVSWDNGGAKTLKQGTADQRRSSIGSTKVNQAERSKSLNARGRASGPRSILTPATQVPTQKGPTSNPISKAPSVASLKSALKSPFRSWTGPKASSMVITEEATGKAGTIPGAWSPPLEKKEKKTRSESTKRRAAELNAERAKAHAAEVDTESLKAVNQRSKATTPLSVVSSKRISKPTATTPSLLQSKNFQSHRKRLSASIKKEGRVVDTTNDDVRAHEVRSLSPASYTHKTFAPHYMDTIADPYAHFVFHYREMAAVSKMCNVRIFETKEELQSRLASLTKQELLELLVQQQSIAEEEADEELSWQTSPGHAGYEPNLNTANEKLDEWGTSGVNSGRNGGGHTNNGANTWGDGGDSGGDVNNFNTVSQDNGQQGGASWNNHNDNHAAKTQGGGDWAAWGNSNDNSGTNAGWDNSNAGGNNDGQAVGGSNGGDDGGGW